MEFNPFFCQYHNFPCFFSHLVSQYPSPPPFPLHHHQPPSYSLSPTIPLINYHHLVLEENKRNFHLCKLFCFSENHLFSQPRLEDRERNPSSPPDHTLPGRFFCAHTLSLSLGVRLISGIIHDYKTIPFYGKFLMGFDPCQKGMNYEVVSSPSPRVIFS